MLLSVTGMQRQFSRAGEKVWGGWKWSMAFHIVLVEPGNSAKHRKYRPNLRRDGRDPPPGETPGLFPGGPLFKSGPVWTIGTGSGFTPTIPLRIWPLLFAEGAFFVPPRRRTDPTRIFHSGMGTSWSSEKRRRGFLPICWSAIADTCMRIPMLPENRSLNLSNAVAIVLYEALRQNGFPGPEIKSIHGYSSKVV